MPDYYTTLFDTAPFGTTANTENLLFKVARGADSTHTESFTNMRGAGQLPATEKFVVRRISAVVDYNITQADVPKWFLASFLDFRVLDRTVFFAPLALLADASGYGGSDTTTAGANGNRVGLLGDGYAFPDPAFYLTLLGGESWYVRVVQGTALAAGSSNIKIVLHGVLTIP